MTSGGSSFGAVSGIGNFGRNAPSMTFNGSGQYIQYGPWTGTADLMSFFMKGSTSAASFFVVQQSVDGFTWTSAGTAVSITTGATYSAPLFATSRYVRISFNLNATCNVYVDDLRIRSATNACTENIQLLQVLINGGCGSCEGSEEFVYFATGSNALDIEYLELVSQTAPAGGCAYGGNGPGDNLNTNWVLNANYTALQTNYIANLNLWASCPDVFVPVPVNNIIPPGARVLAFTGALPTSPYNFDQLCGLGTVYVIFADQIECAGKYANASCSANCQRYLTLFNHQTGCMDNRQYVASPVTTYAGDTYVFVGNNIGYAFTSNCSFLIVPVVFESFSGEWKGTHVELNWKTASEELLHLFVVERSSDGINYYTLDEVYPSNNFLGDNYSFLDDSPAFGVNYYRLRVENSNGSTEYSPLLAVYPTGQVSNVLVRTKANRIIVSGLSPAADFALTAIGINGAELAHYQTRTAPQGMFQFELNTAISGCVLLVIQEDNHIEVKRIVVNGESHLFR